MVKCLCTCFTVCARTWANLYLRTGVDVDRPIFSSELVKKLLNGLQEYLWPNLHFCSLVFDPAFLFTHFELVSSAAELCLCPDVAFCLFGTFAHLILTIPRLSFCFSSQLSTSDAQLLLTPTHSNHILNTPSLDFCSTTAVYILTLYNLLYSNSFQHMHPCHSSSYYALLPPIGGVAQV